jgi:hypothetical protein
MAHGNRRRTTILMSVSSSTTSNPHWRISPTGSATSRDHLAKRGYVAEAASVRPDGTPVRAYHRSPKGRPRTFRGCGSAGSRSTSASTGSSEPKASGPSSSKAGTLCRPGMPALSERSARAAVRTARSSPWSCLEYPFRRTAATRPGRNRSPRLSPSRCTAAPGRVRTAWRSRA